MRHVIAHPGVNRDGGLAKLKLLYGHVIISTLCPGLYI